MLSTCRYLLRQQARPTAIVKRSSNEVLSSKAECKERSRRGGSVREEQKLWWSRVSGVKPSLLSTSGPQSQFHLALLHTSAYSASSSQQSDVPIPEPPVPPVEQIQELVSTGGAEPGLESLGLGGWSPVGILQHCLEYLHVSCDLPWWTTIVIGTVVVRLLMFPLVIISQRNAARMNNNLPQMQKLQMKMSEARERGDRLDAARYAHEMMEFMKEKNLNPLKNMIVPFAQAPLFISFFVGLRRMSNLPIESMKTGGLFWFTDLTVPDQFYLLPLITSATLALTIELGTDAARLNSANMGLMKYFLRAMPIIIFPFTINFSNAILVYWASSNFVSLCQVSILRIPRVREYFNIEKLIVHKKETLPIKEKGFVRGVSDSWTNMKLTRELEERQRIDEINFMRAGRGAVRKTYKFDPTKTTGSSSPASAAPVASIKAKNRE